MQYIAYTPETYHIQYRKEGEEDIIQMSIPIMGSTNFSAVNEQFTLAVDGLDANTTYYATVVSSNTIGTHRTAEVMFQTLVTGWFSETVNVDEVLRNVQNLSVVLINAGKFHALINKIQRSNQIWLICNNVLPLNTE